MFRRMVAVLLLVNTIIWTAEPVEKTVALHNEILAHGNPNITQETHPILYEMVESLIKKAHVSMPKYITLFSSEYVTVSRYGRVNKSFNDFDAHVDALGDLYICTEALLDLSYEEIEGVIATAVAEKSLNTGQTLVFVAVGTFGATLATVYFLNSYYKLKLGTFISEGLEHHHPYDRQNFIEGIVLISITPAAIVTKLVSNNMQKSIDIKAAELVGAQNIINGIKGIARVKDSYVKENFFSRIATFLKLKEVSNFLFYPIRASTPEERIYYLENRKR